MWSPMVLEDSDFRHNKNHKNVFFKDWIFLSNNISGSLKKSLVKKGGGGGNKTSRPNSGGGGGTSRDFMLDEKYRTSDGVAAAHSI